LQKYLYFGRYGKKGANRNSKGTPAAGKLATLLCPGAGLSAVSDHLVLFYQHIFLIYGVALA
jgi:hypothetical protein